MFLPIFPQGGYHIEVKILKQGEKNISCSVFVAIALVHLECSFLEWSTIESQLPSPDANIFLLIMIEEKLKETKT